MSMVTFWFTKVKLELSGLSEVPPRYYDGVLEKLVDAGMYDADGNKLVVA